MKHQNRIAQRIISAAMRSGRQIFKSEEFKINDDSRVDTLNRLGADIVVITLSATVYLDSDGIQCIQLRAKTNTLMKDLNFYNVESSTDLGEKISWIVSELEKGHGKDLKTHEDEWNEYQNRADAAQEYDYDNSWSSDDY